MQEVRFSFETACKIFYLRINAFYILTVITNLKEKFFTCFYKGFHYTRFSVSKNKFSEI